jgi:hypothetical protein
MKPKCPKCSGFIEHEAATSVSAERVYCRNCGWQKLREVVPAPIPKELTREVSDTPRVFIEPNNKRAIVIKGGLIQGGETPPLQYFIKRRTIMSNQLTDLNDRLFATLDRLTDATATGEKLQDEIQRARAVAGISREIISNATLALEAQRTMGGKTPPPMLGISK